MALLAYDKIAPENEANLPKVLDSKYIDWDDKTLKTINNQSIIGEGNIEIEGGGGTGDSGFIELHIKSHSVAVSTSGKRNTYKFFLAEEDRSKIQYDYTYYHYVANGAMTVYKDGSVGGETNYNEKKYTYKAVPFEWGGQTLWQCIFSPTENWDIIVEGNNITLPTGCLYWAGNGTLASLSSSNQSNFIATAWSEWEEDRTLKNNVGYVLFYDDDDVTTFTALYSGSNYYYPVLVVDDDFFIPLRRNESILYIAKNCPVVVYSNTTFGPFQNYINNVLVTVESGCFIKNDFNSTYSSQGLGNITVRAIVPSTGVAVTTNSASYTQTVNSLTRVIFDEDCPADATLSVAGKAAYKIYYKNEPLEAGVIKAGDTCLFTLLTSTQATEAGVTAGWHLLGILSADKGGNGTSSYFGTQTNTEAPSSLYGVHTVSVGDDYKLEKGTILTVKMLYPLGLGAKMNVSETGAKNIRWRGQNIVNISFYTGDLITFMYDGTFYNIISCDRLDNGATRYAKCTTPTDTTLKEVTLSNFTVETGKIIVINFANGFDPEKENQIKFINGTTPVSLDVYYQGSKIGIPIEDGDTATFVVASFDNGIRYLDLQGVNKIGEDTPSQQINIADSQNYNINDDESVPTVKAASDMINSRIVICTESEYLAMTKLSDTIYFITV